MAEQTVTSGAGDDDAERVLGSVRAVLDEMGRTGAPRAPVHLDARFDADLGLDSLSRVELVARAERAFGASLPESVIAEIDTPRDLLRALRASGARVGAELRAGPRETAIEREREHAPGAPAPTDLPTLIDALEWHAREHPERVHVHLLREDGGVDALRYGDLLAEASVLAGGLVARGLAPGDSVAIMLPTGREYLQSFVAILLAGGTPVPIYPPARAKQIEEHFRRHARILANARTRMLVTFDQVKRVSRLLTARVAGLEHLVTPAELAGHGPLELRPRLAGDDVAFLQYTSGSTGDPKGVVLTHANVLASLRCMGRALDAGPDDVFVSWLPLYHDMGLIGAWLGSMVVGFPLVLMSPLAFLARPERWLRAIHRFGGTISGGPNFAYELCLRRIDDDALQGLDLSTWRLAFNGAEPVSAETLDRFHERFARYGLAASALAPVYGLAEATLGVAFTPLGRGPRVDRVEREALFRDGVARPLEDGDGLRFVSSGVAIPEFEVRVVDAAGRELPDRAEGEIQFKGPAVTGGYNRNPEATRALFDGEWVRSGDRGYLADGELYVTGRNKDVVIRAGRNLYPYELEQAVAEVDGVRRGCVAVFGAHDPVDGTEKLVVLAETRERDPAVRKAMCASIESLALEHLDLPADDVVLAPPQTVLKTSSGKIRRSALADLYARGRLGAEASAPWLQVVRLAADSLVPTLRRFARALRERLYVGWFALVLAVHVAWAWPAVVLLPGAGLRWAAARLGARAVLAMAGIPVRVEGPPELGGGPCVLVANHQSYLDGLVLTAVLDRPVRFVVKRELTANVFARTFLDRVGVLYVERFEHGRGVEDARAVSAALAGGDRLGFFAEGTFHRMPGLLPFQLGAFEAAVASGATVHPVVLRGTRDVLRGDDLFVRRRPVGVRFLDPVDVAAVAAEQRWSAALALRADVRARMLAACGEPDLAHRDALAELAGRRRGETADRGR